MKSIVLFLRALLFFALATSLAAGKPVPFIPLVEEDPGYLIQYSGLDVGWTWVPPDQVTYYSSIYTHPDLPDATHTDVTSNPHPQSSQQHVQIYFDALNDKVHVQFGRREGDDPHQYEVSQLKEKAEGKSKYYFTLMCGFWRRTPAHKNTFDFDLMEIKSIKGKLFMRRHKPWVNPIPRERKSRWSSLWPSKAEEKKTDWDYIRNMPV